MTARLDDETANALLATAVANVQRDFPVHWTHFVNSAEDLKPQRVRHPVFAGSFDWHSCVHQTWLIVRLLRLRPQLGGAGDAWAVLEKLITDEGCATEAAFFAGDDGRYWERPYGWAWLLVLDAELRTWAGAGTRDTGARGAGTRDIGAESAGTRETGTSGAGTRDSGAGGTATEGAGTGATGTEGAGTEATRRAGDLAARLRPLSAVLRGRMLDWLRGAALPIRVGTHTNSALACSLVLDAARATGDEELAEAIVDAAHRWYGDDVGYGGFEPDAADFLSPALVETDLMRRVLGPDDFANWFAAFVPDLDGDRWRGLREPVAIDDPRDPYGSHLIGLALSRAWCWRGLASALPAGHRFVALADAAAEVHRDAGWQYVFGYGYASEHWLGTFAAYLDLGALT